MKRRTVLATTATTAIAAIAGCTSETGSETSCPDSPTPIETLDNNDGDVTIIGTVSKINRNDGSIVVDGETGSVIIATTSYPETGACVKVTGRVSSCVGCDDNVYYLDPARWQPT